MAKAKIVNDGEGRFYGIKILCRGCAYMGGKPMGHLMPVHWLPDGATESPYNAGKPHWSFNGDFDKPVFGPSLNTWWGGDKYKREDGTEYESVPLHRCHSFIGCNGAQPGQMIYLGDCTHALAGQVVDLPDMTEEADCEEID